MDASDRLIRAAKSGNTKEVRKLLSRGALFTKDDFGNTALHEAAWSGNNEVVKILLKTYCFVDSVNGAGFTPLHLASQNGHAKVAKTLLRWKANPSLKNQHDENPIHLAAKYDHAHLVPVFAAAKADLDLKAKDENTALHIAAKLGNIASVKALIQNGANPNCPNQRHKLPIDYAEFGKYHDTVKVLVSVTERNHGRAVDKLVLSPSDLEKGKGRRSFFKPRSSKSPKDLKIKNVQKLDSPTCNSSDVKLRPRSNTTGTAVYSKRYSREFEDVSPMLFSSSRHSSSSGGSSSYIRSDRSDRSSGGTRSVTRSPSLEELLEEVEKETLGPNYRYAPPPSSDSDNENGSVSCQPLNRMSSGSLTPNNNSNNQSPSSPIYNFNKPPKLSPIRRRHSPSPLLKSPHQTKDLLYDILTPQGFLKPQQPKNNDEKKEEDGYVWLRPSSEVGRCTSSDGKGNNVYSLPLSAEVLSHRYEYLPPLPKDEGKKEEEGFESYIFMAPRSDLQPKPSPLTTTDPSSSPLKLSPVKKVAVISDDQLERSPTKYEPNVDSKKAPKPILTQFEGERKNSGLEKYLQDELDTIRQAFHIRLSQMEKRYKRHLASVSSIHKTSFSGVVKEPTPNRDNDGRISHNRRASWHGKMKPEDVDSPVSGSAYPLGSGFESGSEESLASSIADSSCYDGFESGDSPEPNVSEKNVEESLDQVNDIHNGEPHLSDFTCEDDSSLPVEMKAVIQERIQQYKSQMMELWMKEAQEKIAAMERQYMEKMGKQEMFHLASQEKGQDQSETFV